MRFAAVSSRIYAGLLQFYPPELLRDFGQDMAETFAEDLAEARRDDGWRGACRVLACMVREFVCLALRRHLASRIVVVPGLLFMGGALLFAMEMLHFHIPVYGTGIVWYVASWPSMAAMGALAAMVAGDRSVPVPLRIE